MFFPTPVVLFLIPFFHLVFLFLYVSCIFWVGKPPKTPIWALVGLAKVGHPNFSPNRAIKVGQSRSKFVGQIGLAKIGQIRMAEIVLAIVGQIRINL